MNKLEDAVPEKALTNLPENAVVPPGRLEWTSVTTPTTVLTNNNNNNHTNNNTHNDTTHSNSTSHSNIQTSGCAHLLHCAHPALQTVLGSGIGMNATAHSLPVSVK